MERLPLLLLVVLSCAGTTVDPPQPPTLEELPAANLKAANATISPRPGPAMSADPLDVWLERLIQVESGGRSGLTIRDQNGRLSRGCLQFQDLTLIAYARKYGFFPNARDTELPSHAYDCQKAKNVARAMIKANPDNWRHWQNSVRKIGLPPRAE